MTYQLVISKESEDHTKDVGENIFLEQLPNDYQVYLFYYPGVIVDQELELSLRKLGEITGNNMLVNIGKLNDPKYQYIVELFEIKDLPVIVMTSKSEYSSPDSGYYSTYIRIDSKRMLESKEWLIQSLEKMFNLFITGEISKALKQFKRDKRNEFLSRMKKMVLITVGKIGKFIDDRDISIAFANVKFEIVKSGGLTNE